MITGTISFYDGYCDFELDPDFEYKTKSGKRYGIDKLDYQYNYDFVVSESAQDIMLEVFDEVANVEFNTGKDTLNFEWFVDNCKQGFAQKGYDLLYDEFERVINKFIDFCEFEYNEWYNEMYNLEISGDL